MEYKTCNKTEIKAKGAMAFEGYASFFGNIDYWDDIIEKGAFKKTIKENVKRIKVLAMHNFYNLIGKPTNLVEDSKGLYFEAKLSDTVLGKDIMTLINDKVLTEMSIGYDTVKDTIDEIEGRKIRRLKEVKLWEISPVTWGANDQAAIKGLPISSDYDNIKSEIKRLEALIEAVKNGTSYNKPPDNELNESNIESLINILNEK